MKKNEQITNYAIIELALVVIATLTCLFIKCYTTYDIGWIVCLYPLFVFGVLQVGIILHSIFLLITAKPSIYKDEEENNNNKEEETANE